MKLRTRLMIDYYVGGCTHALLKPVVILLGKVLHRNHTLDKPQDVTIVKILGGGSLIVAYPALLALRQNPNVKKLRLLASPATKPFGELLGIFDEIITIRDNAAMSLAADSLTAIRRLWRTDTLIDLEIHSRLTTIFCLLTCARNRIGFYPQESFWRRGLSTHLLFCHTASGVYYFYEQIAAIMGSPAVSFSQARRQFRELMKLPATSPSTTDRRIALAPCCSSLTIERMLRIEEWITILSKYYPAQLPEEIHLMGAPSDRPYLQSLSEAITAKWPTARPLNRAGECGLSDSVRQLAQMDRLLSIDSSLLHFARLLGIPTISYWGPTDPRTRLKDLGANDVTHFAHLPCSPCVHLAATTPCRGNNLCMRFAVDPNYPADRNPPWVIS
jgi:ADP-heptose:LPS heptosyltransferase